MAMIAPQDAAFLMLESREHPMHVGALQVFKLPRGAKRDYVGQLFEESLKFTELRPLLRQRPRTPVSSIGQLFWEIDDDVDLDYHVRPSALPAPGRVRELLALVSRLHGGLLDRHRPLWEFHLIEGLQGRRFATYTKIHHSLVDGVAGMRLLTTSLSEDPDATISPFWAARPRGAEPPPNPEDEGNLVGRLFSSIKAAGESAIGMAGGTANLTKLATALLRGQREGVSLPAPKTMWNAPITGARRFAAQSWPIERLKRAGAASGATLNDMVLAMCAGALRRYLEAADALPKRPLISAIPVSLAMRGKTSSREGGNAVGSVLCSLATDIADPRERLAAIRASMETAKEAIANMSPTQFQIAGSVLMATPLTLGAVPGAGVIPPLFNVIISNVPGPPNPLYWNGALLESVYPVSIPFEGQGLNMTVLSSAGSMHFGITGCRRTVPHLQRLLDYLEDSLAELETT
ncbi:WS/DGAT/MGAT family O-acyltransferase [Mycobacterium decipiens]|uniref:Diacylglycerol O-acyltransferase n=1 Tax=Mycobacterium decipiens TaxID=1430326 RepID=A0A1X2LZ09_9MYCO|nr:wax ester/triacylglycerol synthase family O-acyltransferase [Mycobacterium decipiens]OSC42540.1 wax ester/triacylglycerol synthase family O-acyltransferase [Mycobacterium decipiens]